jgi:hypothetical protein
MVTESGSLTRVAEKKRRVSEDNFSLTKILNNVAPAVKMIIINIENLLFISLEMPILTISIYFV